MQTSSVGKTSARRTAFPRWRLVVILAIFWSWMACDTVAEITFIKESLNDLQVIGFRAEACAGDVDPASRCIGCGEIDFVMTTTESRFLTPSLQLVGLDGRLSPGENFGGAGSDFTFDRTWLFELDAVGQDKDCSTDASICGASFTCQALTVDQLPSQSENVGQSRCVREAEITAAAGSVTFTGFGSDLQSDNSKVTGEGYSGLSLILNMDNSGSLLGHDEIGNSVAANKTDPDNSRISAMITFLVELTNDDRNTIPRIEYGLFELAGTGQNGVTNLLKVDAAISSTFTEDQQVVDDQLQRLSNSSSGSSPVYESLVLGANSFVDQEDAARRGHAHRILSLVDSGDDGSVARDATSAVDAMTADGVNASATIVHFDYADRGDQENRTGPIPEYERVACSTGGYYLYDLYPQALSTHMRRLGKGYEGRWSIDVQVVATGAGGNTAIRDLPPGSYRAAGVMTVHVADTSADYEFQLGCSNTRFCDNPPDSRLLFIVEDQTATP